MQNGLDRLLATYCSPTLAGIKPASLVSCDRNLYPDLPQRLKEYRDAFSAREIHFEIVCLRQYHTIKTAAFCGYFVP